MEVFRGFVTAHTKNTVYIDSVIFFIVETVLECFGLPELANR